MNMRTGLIASGIAVGLGLLLQISGVDWMLIALAMAGIWSAAALHRAVERSSERARPERQRSMSRYKDLAAGAVLLATLGAATVGAIVFLPPLVVLLAHCLS